jgi:hypothetical protein
MIDELDAVRRVGAELDAADAAARARVRDRVLDGPPSRRRRPGPRWIGGLLLPAAAVAGAVALVVALGGEDRDRHAAQGTMGATTPARATPSAPPSLFPAPDQYLYVQSVGRYLTCSVSSDTQRCTMGPRRTREVWLSERHDGRLVEDPSSTPVPTDLGHAQLWLGNRRFTHDELAAYAPTGAELLAALQAGHLRGQGGDAPSYPYVQLTDALREAAMPPAVRRAIVEALPLVPGVRSLGAVTDSRGRPGIAFSREDQGRREEVIVDPAAFVMLEERDTLLDPAKVAPGLRAGDRIGEAVYLQRAVVDRVGETR